MNNNHLGVKSVRSLVQPGDGVMPLVKGINSAKKSVEILIFRFDRTEIERALAHAVSRGIFVHALIAYTNRGGEKNLRALEMRLLAAGVTVARTADDFPKAFASMVERGAEAVVLFEDPLFTGEAGKIAALAIRHRLLSIGQVAYAEAGGLIGNGANQLELFRRAGGYVDRILKGARPADLPIEQASRFELILNMNTATALGVSIPKVLQFRADRIIE